MRRSFKDWWLGGDPADENWMQGLEVVGWGPFPMFGERARMQKARAHARTLADIAAGIHGPVISNPDNSHTADIVMPGWLARELPSGSLVARELDRFAGSCGRFRLSDGTWVPEIESDRDLYRVLYLAESSPVVR